MLTNLLRQATSRLSHVSRSFAAPRVAMRHAWGRALQKILRPSIR
jgi:hypothetical protein